MKKRIPISSGKRSKRPLSSSASAGGSSGKNRHPHGPVGQAANAEKDESDQGKRQHSQRLYHGVCPDVSNRYRKVGDGRIGQGTYGVVYCARDLWKEEGSRDSVGNDTDGNPPARLSKEGSNEVVALKKCYAHHEASDGFPITTLREIHALRICSSHPNIVDLLEIAVSSSSSSSSRSNRGSNDITIKNIHGNSNDDDDDNGKNNGNPKAKGSTTTTTRQTSTIKIGKSNVFLVFEHCRYDLAHILDSYHEYQHKNHRRASKSRGSSGSLSSPFSLSQTKTLVLQLLSALEFCHGHRLIHRDIKPSNLLYDTITGRLKVCDFGLSRTATETNVHMTPEVVSLWYRAPELLLSASKRPRDSLMIKDNRIRYSFPIDLWATGCVAAELLQGQPFLDGSSEIDQLQKMQDALGPPPSDLYSVPRDHNSIGRDKNMKNQSSHPHHRSIGLWDRFEHLPPEGLTLLAKLLDYDPNGRWDASTALGANFLSPTSIPAPILDLRSMPRGFPGC